MVFVCGSLAFLLLLYKRVRELRAVGFESVGPKVLFKVALLSAH